MSSFRESTHASPFEPTIGNPNAADDGGVVELNPADRPGGLTNEPLQGGDIYAGTYGGRFGLGAQWCVGVQSGIDERSTSSSLSPSDFSASDLSTRGFPVESRQASCLL